MTRLTTKEMNPYDKVNIFLYGTLKKDLPNHMLLRDFQNGKAKYTCTARTKSKYPLVMATDCNMPFMLNKPDTGHFVTGEVYRIDQRLLSRLDKLFYLGQWYDYQYILVQSIPIEEGDEEKEIECLSFVLNYFHDKLLELPMLESYTHQRKYCAPNRHRTLFLYQLIRQTKTVYDEWKPHC